MNTRAKRDVDRCARGPWSAVISSSRGAGSGTLLPRETASLPLYAFVLQSVVIFHPYQHSFPVWCPVMCQVAKLNTPWAEMFPKAFWKNPVPEPGIGSILALMR